MPITTLSLTQASIIWRPGHRTRLGGCAVLSAVAYDGTKGILPGSPLPAIPFRRQARKSCDLIAPGTAGVGDDGLLIATFPDIPMAVGWAITMTLTANEEQAKKVIESTLQAAEAALPVIPGMAVLKGVTTLSEAISGAILGVMGARNVGTWINSESDADDLGRDWRLSSDHFKARFELDYDIKGVADD